MSRATRIILNTAASYARLIISAACGLVALPLALRTLGIVDYGIFSVIGGVLSSLLVINGPLTAGAQRHIAYSLGEGKPEEAGEWFQVSLLVHLLMGATLLVAGLLASQWVLVHVLSLPAARLSAAAWVYHFAVVAIVCTVIATPYHALLVARESIVSLSFFSGVGSACFFVGVLCLRLMRGDSLIWYSGFFLVNQLITFLGPVAVCMFRHPECRRFSRHQLRWHKVKKLLGFSSCSLMGGLAGQAGAQGPAVLLNRFVGTTANAAYGVVQQLNAFTTGISGGVFRAIYPAIVKFEASGDRQGMLWLSNLTNKYAFVILWLAVAPVLCDTRNCLQLWLHSVPPVVEAFTMPVLVIVLADQLISGFMASAHAGGRIALYQGIISFPVALSLTAGYCLLLSGMPAASVLWAGVGSSVLSGIGRLWFVTKRLGFRPYDWFRDALLPCFIICATCSSGLLIAANMLNPGFLRMASLYLLNTVLVIPLAAALAGSTERSRWGRYIRSLRWGSSMAQPAGVRG